MEINYRNNLTFGWNIKTHLAITEKAAQDNSALSKVEKRMLARFSQMPDKDPKEIVDFVSPHFYDALHTDPSFGTLNDAKNNAMSRFLHHTSEALKQNDRDAFLRETGYAVHYLQDVSTPPHTEHGNYFQKLFRIPMHKKFEKGKKSGASSRLDILLDNYKFEDLSPSSNLPSGKKEMLSSLERLLHNTALFTVQKENVVKYTNLKKWPMIQQRCFDRGVNVTKVFLDMILQYLPKAK